MTKRNTSLLVLSGGLLFLVMMLLILAAPAGVSGQTPQTEVTGVIHRVDLDANGAGDGTSWADAFTSLQDALDVAQPGDEIWVAAGTYLPSQQHGGTGNRYKSFQIENGLALYGGFNGTESERDERDWQVNVVILSGDIGVPGVESDNSYHVFYHPDTLGLDGTAVLDGFTIAGGKADGEADHGSGGGMFNDHASPTLANLIFSGNSADYGGAVYNHTSSPSIADSTFVDNSAIDGGAMYNYVNASPILSDCLFLQNTASDDGGGVASYSSTPGLDGCDFEGNVATQNGGGMYNWSSSPTLVHCSFSGNSSEYAYGGGMYSDGSSPSLTSCTFTGNSVYADGGGMFGIGGTAVVSDCLFVGNTAWAGGGMAGLWSSPVLTGCLFASNFAGSVGGGLHSGSGSPVVVNSVFWRNQAATGGGLNICDNASLELTNCTLFGNVADDVGGGFANRDNSVAVVVNSILWNNYPAEIFNDSSTATVTYSDVQGGYPGVGNLDADPQFADAEDGDLHLAGTSPCIDAGLNAAPNLPALDFEGDDRIIDGDLDSTPTVDMGADEALEPITITGLQIEADDPTALGSATTLTGTVTTGNNVLYEWDFGDGGADVGQVVTHTYSAEGTYAVQLQASNMQGSATASATVTIVRTDFWIHLPLVMKSPGAP